MVGESCTYVSKGENGKLDFGDYSSEDLIRRPAAGAAEEALLLSAGKTPPPTRRRFFERPGAFRQTARPGDKTPERLPARIDAD